MTTDTTSHPKYPSHTAYFLKDKEGQEKPDWLKTGVAWEHADQEGLNLSLTVLGQQISLVIRKNKPKEV
ncbi:hypothetical protein [Runella zeae]|uniref:hypothetical protein n=1 Tax=Runella zeae TaxID=94255 RepID=UPI00235583E2|nr:hypothetical protein [Runella zeae]